MAETSVKFPISTFPCHIIVEILKKMKINELLNSIKSCHQIYSIASRTSLRIPIGNEVIVEARRYQYPIFYLHKKYAKTRLFRDVVRILRMFQFKKVDLVVEQSFYYKQRVEEILKIYPLREGEFHLDLLKATPEMLELAKDLQPRFCGVTFDKSLSTEEMTKIMINSPVSFSGSWELVTDFQSIWESFKEIIGSRETFAFHLARGLQFWQTTDRLLKEWLSDEKLRTKRVILSTLDLSPSKNSLNGIKEYDEILGEEFCEEFRWRKSFSKIYARRFPKSLLMSTCVYHRETKVSEEIIHQVDSLESFLDAFYFIVNRIKNEEYAEKLKEEKWKNVLSKTFEHYWPN